MSVLKCQTVGNNFFRAINSAAGCRAMMKKNKWKQLKTYVQEEKYMEGTGFI